MLKCFPQMWGLLKATDAYCTTISVCLYRISLRGYSSSFKTFSWTWHDSFYLIYCIMQRAVFRCLTFLVSTIAYVLDCLLISIVYRVLLAFIYLISNKKVNVLSMWVIKNCCVPSASSNKSRTFSARRFLLPRGHSSTSWLMSAVASPTIVDAAHYYRDLSRNMWPIMLL